MQFNVAAEIEAPVERVWAILADLPRWTDWNTTVARTEGTVALGNKVTIEVHAQPGRAFPLKVTTFEPDRRLVFTGGMPLGLFKGVRTYTLDPTDAGTSFTMQESYDGLLAGIITKRIPDLQPAFDEFAACLKMEAEKA